MGKTAGSGKRPVGRFKDQVRELRERQLLFAAEKLLAKDGCERFTVGKLAAAAGVAKGTVYTHYKSEQELLRTVLTRISAELVSLLDQDGKRSARKRLELSLDALGGRVAGRPNGHLGFPCCMKRSPCPFVGMSELEAILGQMIERARAEGTIPDDTNAELVASLFVSSVATVSGRHDDPLKLKEEFSFMCRFFLRGLVG